MPRMKINMPTDRFIVCELAAKGYGTLTDLVATRADLVLDAFDHMNSMREYEERFHQLNEPKGTK
jgi:hypothetical protein